MATVVELIDLLNEAEVDLKNTTLGYKSRLPQYWQNPATNWYKGLSKIDQVLATLETLQISITGTPQEGKDLTAVVNDAI